MEEHGSVWFEGPQEVEDCIVASTGSSRGILGVCGAFLAREAGITNPTPTRKGKGSREMKMSRLSTHYKESLCMSY